MQTDPASHASCPVPLELLALLLRSDAQRLRALADELPDMARAALALHCFSRYHLRRLGFAVALRCSESALEAVGGPDGRHLLDLARNAAGPADEPVRCPAPARLAA